MNSLLQSSGSGRRALPLSVAAWHVMIDQGLAPRRAEMLRGVIYEKMSKSILHIKLAARLLDVLQKALGDEYWVRKEDPLTFADSEPEPDLSVVAGRESDYFAHPQTAVLVVEVAVSSVEEDRGMANLYAEAGVAEFWIVNGAARCVEVFRRPEAGHYREQSRRECGEPLVSAELPQLKVDLRELFDVQPGS